MSQNKRIIIAVVLILLFFWYMEKGDSKKYDYEPEISKQNQKEKYPPGQEFDQLGPYYSEKGEPEIPYSIFLKLLDQKAVEKVTVGKEKLKIKLKNQEKIFTATLTKEDPGLIPKLKSSGAEFSFEESGSNIFSWIFWIFVIFLIVSILRRNQIAGGKWGDFTKTGSKKITVENRPQTTFNDVAGIEEAKESTREIVEFLKNPEVSSRLGGRLPKGVLFLGPPGCGKTLLAKAVAGEARVPFFHSSGSEFVEMFVGVGAARIRNLFKQANNSSPSIIFIDEFEALAKSRGTSITHDEREQTLNQLLIEMDGMETNQAVIVIGATNRPDMLDAAVLRPGRFDRNILIAHPDIKGRKRILEIHTKDIVLGRNVKLETIARGTIGFTGADLANLANEAALLATRKKKRFVEMKDFEEAKDVILMGYERKTIKLNDRDKTISAVHETGHALVNAILYQKDPEHTDPLHKISIIPRSKSLGVTVSLPREDRYTMSEIYMLNEITILLAGRAAEEVKLKEKSAGAQNDLKRATEIIRKMICELGMNKKIGLAVIEQISEHPFLGKRIGQEIQKVCSEQTAREIDEEIKEILNQKYEECKQIITTYGNAFDAIVSSLWEKENLTGEETVEIIKKT